MKNSILIIVVTLFCSCSISKKENFSVKSNINLINYKQDSIISGIASLSENLSDSGNIKFFIKEKKDTNEQQVYLEFKNLTNNKLRLLKVFDPLGIFFSINMIDDKGNIYDILRGGKADIPLNLMSYENLPPNSSYNMKINLSDVLKNLELHIPSGEYKLKMIYHNQYGDNCVKGWYTSNEIIINL